MELVARFRVREVERKSSSYVVRLTHADAGGSTGALSAGMPGDVGYLAAVGLIGVTIAGLRLRSRLLK